MVNTNKNNITWEICDDKIRVNVDEEADSCAYYLILNNSVVEKRWYSQEKSVHFLMQSSGVYFIRVFICNRDNKQIIDTDPIYFYRSGWCLYYKIEEMEMTNICNLSCANCGNMSSTYPRGYIDDATVLSTLQWMTPGQTLNYHRVGEPLLHKNLEKYIEWGIKAGINPVISTNGILLNDERIKSLYECGLRYLVITLHSPESLEAFIRSVSFLSRKSESLLNFSRRYNSSLNTTNRFYIQGKLLNIQNTDKQGEELRKALESIPHDFREYVTLTPVHDWAGNAQNAQRIIHNSDIVRKNCYFINRKVVNVRWDGTIVGCCFDFNNENEIGNIRDYVNLDVSRDKYKLCSYCHDNWAVNNNT